jgi:hypothetical protein
MPTDLEPEIVRLEPMIQLRTYEARDLESDRRAVIQTFAIIQRSRQLR